MSTFLFTYQQDPPRIVTSVQVVALAYDQALYIATEFAVERDSEILYTHPRSILSIAVYESILYVCDGTLEITRYHLWKSQYLRPYRVSSPPCQVKVYQSALYVLTQLHLLRVDLHTQVQRTETLDTSRHYRSMAFYQDRTYFLTLQKDTLEGRLFSGEDLYLGLEDPADLVLIYPYLFISGNAILQYDLIQRRIVDTYESTNVFRQINRYTSMAAGPSIYLANVTRNQVDRIPVPPTQTSEIQVLYLIPSRGTTGTRVTLTGTNVDQLQQLTLGDQPVQIEPISTTSLSFEVPEGEGLATLRIQTVPQSLTFQYENPRLYQCIPGECFEGQDLYLHGEYLDQIRYVIVNGEKVVPTLLTPRSLSIRSPPGDGTATLTLIDALSNVFYTNISFRYLRLESTICFPAGTLVHSDQGAIEIQKLIPGKHTLYGKEIRLITDTYCLDSELVCVEKDTFAEGYPYQRTILSKHHKIYFRRMIEAQEFVHKVKGVTWVPYDGTKLYNVLLYEAGRMNVQGMICETLDPSNPIVNHFSQKLIRTSSGV